MNVRRVVARLGQHTIDDIPRVIEGINLADDRCRVVAAFEGERVGFAVISVEGDYVYADIELTVDAEPPGVPVLDLVNDGNVLVTEPRRRQARGLIRFVNCSPAAVTYTPNPAWTDVQLTDPGPVEP